MNYTTQIITHPEQIPLPVWERLLLGMYSDIESGRFPPTVRPFCCWSIHVDPHNLRIVSTTLAFPEVSPTDIQLLQQGESEFLSSVRQKLTRLYQ